MRKGIADAQKATVQLTVKALQQLERKGFRYVQVLGLTHDHHYDYIEPHRLVLVPIISLPTDPARKEIYEPIDSKILRDWANEHDDMTEILIAKAG